MAQRLVWSRRQPAVAIGSSVAAAPPRVNDQPLPPPKNKDVPGVEAVDQNIVASCGHYTVQQQVQQLSGEGMIYGAGSSAFSGDVQLNGTALTWSRRYGCPPLGQPVSVVPPRTNDQTLWVPTNKQVPRVETLPAGMAILICHFYAQEAILLMIADGPAYGPGSTTFSGDTNIL